LSALLLERKPQQESFISHFTTTIPKVGFTFGSLFSFFNRPFLFLLDIIDPDKVLGRTFYGIVGSGVYNLTKIPPPEAGRIVTTTRSHSTGLISDVVNSVAPTSGKIWPINFLHRLLIFLLTKLSKWEDPDTK